MGLSRRGFLGALGGGAIALGCGGSPRGGRFAGFNLAIQSYTFRTLPLEDALTQIASLGITRVEMSPQSHWGYPKSDDEIAALRALLDSYDLDCVTSGLEPAEPENQRAVFEYAKKLGLKTIMVDPQGDWLDGLEALVDEFDIRVGIHNHGPGTRYSSIADVAAALEGRDRRIGTIIDTGHYTRAGEDPIKAFEKFAYRVYGVHLKDVAGKNPAAPDRILGEGVVDLVGVFRILREINFPADASLSLEYEGNPQAPYDDVAICLDNAERAARMA